MRKQTLDDITLKRVIEGYTFHRKSLTHLASTVNLTINDLRIILQEAGVEVNPDKDVDLSGRKLGKLFVIEPSINQDKRTTSWVCQCECGNKEVLSTRYFIHPEEMLACSVCRPKNSRYRDLVGKTFGSLLVMKSLGKSRWECRCNCGRFRIVPTGELNAGRIRFCRVCAKQNKKQQLPFGKASFNVLYNSYKKGAEERGLPFPLSKEEFESLTLQNCYYCGIPPRQVKRNSTSKYQFHGDYIYNGIDRVDNTLGYSLDNCVPCCKICNRAKDVLSFNDYKFWILKSYESLYTNTISNNSDKLSNIIAISGYASCGKDTFADLLTAELIKDNLKIYRAAFGDFLKAEFRDKIYNLYNIDIFTASRPEKEKVRHFLVEKGEELRKDSGGRYFVDKMFNEILTPGRNEHIDYHLITDLRYDQYGPNDELQSIKRWNGTIVYIEKFFQNEESISFLRPPNIQEEENCPKIKAQADYHIIWKHGDSIDELKRKVREFVEYLKYSRKIVTPPRNYLTNKEQWRKLL